MTHPEIKTSRSSFRLYWSSFGFLLSVVKHASEDYETKRKNHLGGKMRKESIFTDELLNRGCKRVE